MTLPEPLDLENAKEVSGGWALLIVPVFGAAVGLFAAATITLSPHKPVTNAANAANAEMSNNEYAALLMLRLGADRWQRACAYQAGAEGMSREGMEKTCSVDYHLGTIPKMQSPVDPQ